MKKKISKIILGVIVSLLFSVPSIAAEAIFQPSDIKVDAGEPFSVSVYIDPQGVNNYVEKLNISYPADMIEINSFSFDSAWMPLSQPGYDLIDNGSGTLVKSAGFPGGFSSPVPFGTISFIAKKKGSGEISVGNGSMAFEIDNQSTISGLPASVVITGPAAVVLEESLLDFFFSGRRSEPSIEPSNMQEEGEEKEREEGTEEEKLIADIDKTSFMGAIGNILTLGTENIAVGAAVILLMALAVLYLVKLIKKKKKK
jgi:hypothetical protein